jgi:hypothetical protein
VNRSQQGLLRSKSVIYRPDELLHFSSALPVVTGALKLPTQTVNMGRLGKQNKIDLTANFLIATALSEPT